MSLRDPKERTATGIATQTEILGKASPAPKTLLDEAWRDFVFAEVWTRPGLDRRSRYLISMGTAADSPCGETALDGYVRGALKGGELTLSELREAALHLGIYAGLSRGTALDRAIDRVADELGLAPVTLPPIRAEAWDQEERLKEGDRNFDAVMTFGGPPPVAPYFETGILGFVFGEMWMRPGLDQRSRRWLTLVGVANSSSTTPIQSHIHAAMASGNCTPAEMHEFTLQYAVHSGWPRASVIQGVVFEMAKKVAAGLPFDG